NIHSENKEQAEDMLKAEIRKHLDELSDDQNVMLKLTIPTQPDLYKSLIHHPRVVQVVALSGGYSREEANALLKKNDKLIASFSRALTADLNADQSDEEFDQKLKEAIDSIYDASVNKN